MMKSEALFTTESRTLNSCDLTQPKSSENIFFSSTTDDSSQNIKLHQKMLKLIISVSYIHWCSRSFLERDIHSPVTLLGTPC